MLTKTTKFFAIIGILISLLFLSSCSHNDDISSNSDRNQTFTGERFSVKRPGFKFVNKPYEQFRDEMFKQEKSGTPWRDQEYNVKQLYEERLKYEQRLIEQGYNGYPSSKEEFLHYSIENMKPVLTETSFVPFLPKCLG